MWWRRGGAVDGSGAAGEGLPCGVPASRRAGGVARILGSPWPRLALLLCLLGAAGTAIAVRGVPDPDELRSWTAGTGAWGPLAFVGIYALGTVLLLPASLLTVAGGLLFGVATGSVLVLAGATIGAVASFLLGRVLGRPAVERMVGGRIERLDGFLARRGLPAVIGLRLVPVVPFSLFNYGAGVTALRLRDYTIGSVIGMAPGVVAYTSLGGSATEPTSPRFLLSAGALALLALGGTVAARIVRRRQPPGSA